MVNLIHSILTVILTLAGMVWERVKEPCVHMQIGQHNPREDNANVLIGNLEQPNTPSPRVSRELLMHTLLHFCCIKLVLCIPSDKTIGFSKALARARRLLWLAITIMGFCWTSTWKEAPIRNRTSFLRRSSYTKSVVTYIYNTVHGQLYMPLPDSQIATTLFDSTNYDPSILS